MEINKYLIGFNHGYYLGKFNPKLAKTLRSNELKTEYSSALLAGISRVEQEKLKERQKKLDRSKASRSKGLGRER